MSPLAEAIASPAGMLAILACLAALTVSRPLVWPALAGGRLGAAAVVTASVAAAVYSAIVYFTDAIGA